MTGGVVQLWAILACCGLACVTPPANAKSPCVAIADAASGKVLKQQGRCDQRVTPASTFKIAISLMGYDAGFLIDEHRPALSFQKGYPDWIPEWRATTDPARWIKNSVVWYSQQKISPLDQLEFLEKVVKRQLRVTAHAYDMTSRITEISVLSNGWDIHQKTGTGAPLRTDGSDDDDHALGWFVGWASKGRRTLVFARLIQDEKPESIRAGLRARDAFMQEAAPMLDAL